MAGKFDTMKNEQAACIVGMIGRPRTGETASKHYSPEAIIAPESVPEALAKKTEDALAMQKQSSTSSYTSFVECGTADIIKRFRGKHYKVGTEPQQ